MHTKSICVFQMCLSETKLINMLLLKVCLLQRDIFFTYYPKRLGQVLFIDAPWIFQPSWSLFKPLLGKYAGLVAFVSREQLRDNHFKPETVPDEFKHD